MPWKLIGILTILTLFLVFSGFNVHKITIYFGPFALENIPVFVVITFTFILGALTALPFSLITSYKKRKKLKNEKKAAVEESREIKKEQQQYLKNGQQSTGQKKKQEQTKQIDDDQEPPGKLEDQMTVPGGKATVGKNKTKKRKTKKK